MMFNLPNRDKSQKAPMPESQVECESDQEKRERQAGQFYDEGHAAYARVRDGRETMRRLLVHVETPTHWKKDDIRWLRLSGFLDAMAADIREV